MNRIRFTFHSITDPGFFPNLGVALESQPVHDIINVSPQHGIGQFVKREVDNNISIFSWQFHLNKNFIFDKTPVLHDRNNALTITFITEATKIYALYGGNALPFELKRKRNVLMMQDSARLKLEIPAGEKVRAFSVAVSKNWLHQEITPEISTPPILLSATTCNELKTLGELMNNIDSEKINPVSLKSRAWSLVTDFYSRIIKEKSVLKMADPRILQAAELIRQHATLELPNIETIARQLAMSASTLKRHFKNVFGQSIYEHYLSIKMEHARQLLLEQSITVSEVASLLHYEKVSCFIDMFKKHFGISPGEFKKESA